MSEIVMLPLGTGLPVDSFFQRSIAGLPMKSVDDIFSNKIIRLGAQVPYFTFYQLYSFSYSSEYMPQTFRCEPKIAQKARLGQVSLKNQSPKKCTFSPLSTQIPKKSHLPSPITKAILGVQTPIWSRGVRTPK